MLDGRARSKRTHGDSEVGGRTDEYIIWTNMKQRCTNPKNPAYHNYGGRGITVCERWLGSFENFLADMSRRPTKRHEIERRNNDLGYSPDNCEWATPDVQGKNRRNNRFITVGDLTMIVSDWAKHSGISRKTIRTRLADGWSDERAVTEPVHTNRRLAV